MRKVREVPLFRLVFGVFFVLVACGYVLSRVLRMHPVWALRLEPVVFWMDLPDSLWLSMLYLSSYLVVRSYVRAPWERSLFWLLAVEVGGVWMLSVFVGLVGWLRMQRYSVVVDGLLSGFLVVGVVLGLMVLVLWFEGLILFRQGKLENRLVQWWNVLLIGGSVWFVMPWVDEGVLPYLVVGIYGLTGLGLAFIQPWLIVLVRNRVGVWRTLLMLVMLVVGSGVLFVLLGESEVLSAFLFPPVRNLPLFVLSGFLVVSGGVALFLGVFFLIVSEMLEDLRFPLHLWQEVIAQCTSLEETLRKVAWGIYYLMEASEVSIYPEGGGGSGGGGELGGGVVRGVVAIPFVRIGGGGDGVGDLENSVLQVCTEPLWSVPICIRVVRPYPFTSYEKSLLQEVVSQIPLLVAYCEVLASVEMRVRAETVVHALETIQSMLMPGEVWRYRGLVVARWYASAEEAGGDIYLVNVLEGGERVRLVVGDASGKGLSAGLLMVYFAGLFQATSFMDLGRSLWVIERSLGGTLARDNQFFTALFVQVDFLRGLMDVVRFGHPYPVVVEPGRGVRYLERGFPPLGVLEGGLDSERGFVPHYRLGLEPGLVLVMWTDGFLEWALSRVGSPEALLRLVEVVYREVGCDAVRFLECFRARVASVGGGEDSFPDVGDDRMLVVLSFQG